MGTCVILCCVRVELSGPVSGVERYPVTFSFLLLIMGLIDIQLPFLLLFQFLSNNSYYLYTYACKKPLLLGGEHGFIKYKYGIFASTKARVSMSTYLSMCIVLCTCGIEWTCLWDRKLSCYLSFLVTVLVSFK